MATKKPTKKKSTKKAAASKSATKKAATKKAATKKAATKKAATKKAAVKKPSKKAATKKTAAKKAAPKKAPASVAVNIEPPAAPPEADPAVTLGLVEERNPNLDIPVKIGKRDFKQIESELRRIRAELTSDLDALTEQNLSNSGRDQSGDLSGYGFHMADVATDNWTREMELNIATGENDRLRLVEEALDRLERGTYGRCDECAIPINVERLKVLPYAPLCIDCAETLERG